MKYCYGIHTIYKIQYYFIVVVTKYHYQALQEAVRLKVRRLARLTKHLK